MSPYFCCHLCIIISKFGFHEMSTKSLIWYSSKQSLSKFGLPAGVPHCIRIQFLMTLRFSTPLQHHLNLPPPPSLLVALTPAHNFYFCFCPGAKRRRRRRKRRSIVSVPVESRSMNKRQWQWSISRTYSVSVYLRCVYVCMCACVLRMCNSHYEDSYQCTTYPNSLRIYALTLTAGPGWCESMLRYLSKIY